MSTACAARASLAILLLSLPGAPALADQLVFGSFRSAENANNWAHKLSAMFGVEVGVAPFSRQDRQMFRVRSEDLQGERLATLKRRAEAAGIVYWRLLDDTAETAGPPPRPVRQANPLGAPRRQPPGPVSAGPQTPRKPPPQQAADAATPPAANEQAVPVLAQGAPSGRAEQEWDIGLQTRSFTGEGVYGQDQFEGSISVQLEYFRGWRNDTRSFTFTPFLRLDSADDERTHADLRELFYSHVSDSWDVHVGARRVFWGVTEFHHLIDVVNQTDLVENIDTEDKLGQPMVQLSLVRDWGILDLYALAGFRERTFPGSDGRVRLPFDILDDARYESGAERQRVDAAMRWSHYVGPFEVGLHHFSGTSRDPMLVPELGSGGAVVLRPYYPVIDQTGIDAQAFYGDWAFKLEGFTRSGFGDRYAAANVGLERTLVGVMGTRADLGLVVEYMFDERDDEAFNTLFERDVALGGRLQINDFSDTQALLGLILDTDNDDYFVSLEASRRVGDSWLMSLEGRVFAGGERLRRSTPAAVLLQPSYKSAWLQEDDYLQLEFKKFF